LLSYPFGQKQSPKPGSIKEVADGVYWLRMSLPFALDHINLWLLEEEGGWTVVDTGIATQFMRDAWELVIDNHFNGKPINRVIITHLHPDHIGLAGWLTERFNCELCISQMEYQLCQSVIETTSKPITDRSIKFYQSAGYNEEQLAIHKVGFGHFAKVVSPLPSSYNQLKDAECLVINDRSWEIVIGSGHSPEHVCLYCPELNILISGDQVLPRITSNISIFPMAPNDNPLENWLNSCSNLRKRLPDDILVLPSHQEPFYGLHHRLSSLIESHNVALEKLLSYLETPKMAIDCITTMFGRKIGDSEMLFAIGETLAHLNYLIQKGKVKRETSTSGVDYYSQDVIHNHSD